MKPKIITLTALFALSLASVAWAQDQDNDGNQRRGGRGMRHDPLARMTETLDLTADQKAKIQPILDDAKPKMEAIRREAMEKGKAVIDDAMAKIRPMLTADQQKKLDDAKSEHRDHGRKGPGGDPSDND